MTDKLLDRCVSVGDVRALARDRLPLPIFDLIDGGSADEVTMRKNAAAFDELEFKPRFARDVSSIDTSTRSLGVNSSFPLILAPTGAQAFIHKDGELAPARAASLAGIMYALSTFSTASIEEVAEVCPGPKMFQLYALTDESVTDELVIRARQSGYDALCLTIDVPVNAGLERIKRWGVNPVAGLPPLGTLIAMARRPRWTLGQGRAARLSVPDVAKRLAARGHVIAPDFFDTIIRKNLTWEDIPRVVREWNGPLMIKGILCAEDAVRAAEVGATAVAVCNHGGTSLDGSPATISILEEIVDAVGHRVEVIQAGGVRRGQSVTKALALGAAATMIGRPFLYGLAASGEEGVTRVIEILREEFEITMKLCGATNSASLDRSMIRSGKARSSVP